MHVKRGVWIAIVFYVSCLVVCGATAALMGVDLSLSPSEIPSSFWIVSLIEMGVLTAICTKWYLDDVRAKGARAGFEFGIIALIVGAILDLLVLFPLMTQGGDKSDLLAFYTLPWFWMSLIILLATAAIVGGHQKK